jgi:oligoendopeptidase F
MTSAVTTHWNLKKHFYSSLKDPRIRRDIEKEKRAYRAFEKKWRHTDSYLTNETALLRALRDIERLTDIVGPGKPGHYLSFVKDLDAQNTDAVALSHKLSYEMKQEAMRTLFFATKISKIPAAQQKKFLASKKLAPYRHMLDSAFRHGRFTLSEPEERISGFLSKPAVSMWEEGGERILSSMTVRFKGKDIPRTQAAEMLPKLSRTDRRALHALLVEKNKAHADYAENELNAIVTFARTQDDLRGHTTPFESTVMSYENDPKTVETLIATATKRFDIAHRFYAAKSRLLGLKKLQYVDRIEQIGDIKKRIPFPAAVQKFARVLEGVDPQYQKIFQTMLAEGQIDVYPKKGKRGGAFCAATLHGPTFVLLNHADTIRSYSTLAHEMGHAIHSERIKTQPTLYQGYSTATAETASTLFEHIAMAEIEAEATDNERLILLNNRLEDAIGTTFRQIACFNFEREMHETIRAKGAVSKDELAAMMQKHLATYLGPAVTVTRDDGYAFASWPHIRYGFYVYTYAYGFLVSQALFSRYRKNHSFIKKIDEFLCARESDFVENIFKKIGINLRTKKFWEDGLRAIEEDVKEFERLVRTKKR